MTVSMRAMSKTLAWRFMPTATQGAIAWVLAIWPCRRRGMIWMVDAYFDRLPYKSFDCLQGVALAIVAERQCHAIGAGSARATDSVHVRFRIDRQIVINHVADGIDIN